MSSSDVPRRALPATAAAWRFRDTQAREGKAMGVEGKRVGGENDGWVGQRSGRGGEGGEGVPPGKEPARPPPRAGGRA